MVISYYGLGMVKVQLGDLVLVFNPIGAGAAIKPARFGADIALASLCRSDYHGLEAVARGDRVPLALDGPGEYETRGVFIRGLATAGPAGLTNTVFSVLLDEVRLAHLGALISPALGDETKEALAAVDILFVPIGGVDLIGAKAAAALASSLEPKVIIPVEWSDEKTLQTFLREAGEGTEQPVESWSVKRRDLAEKVAEVVVIKSF